MFASFRRRNATSQRHRVAGPLTLESRILLASDLWGADWAFDHRSPESEIPTSQDVLQAAFEKDYLHSQLTPPEPGQEQHEEHDHGLEPDWRRALGMPGPWSPYRLDALPEIAWGDSPQETQGDGGLYESYPLAETFLLHSKTDSDYTIYLDFDGHTTTGTTWNSSSRPSFTSRAWSLDSDFDNFSDTELARIQRVWVRVAEDFAPFDVNVTTEEPDVERLRRTAPDDQQYGVRVVISQDSAWLGSSPGGIAYLNSFRDSTDEPVFVFTSSEKGVAEATSHEVGHSIGLSHDGTSSASYYTGHGSGATSWGPIMGSGYTVQLTQWSRGEYNDANNTQDDYSVISPLYLPFRQDDYADAWPEAQLLATTSEGALETAFGIIETPNDLDAFSFYANAGPARIQLDPLGFGANLDLRAALLDYAGNEILASNPTDAIDAVLELELPYAGRYHLSIDGVGKGDPAGTGYSDYGSLGHYRITGDVPAFDSLDVFGTEGEDVIELDVSGDAYIVTVNGMESEYSGQVITEIRVHGLAGWDLLRVAGSAADEQVSLGLEGLAWTGPQLALASAGVEAHELSGGGGRDSAEVRGSEGDDLLAFGDALRLQAPDVFDAVLSGFAELVVDGGDGADSGELHDTPADETWTAWPTTTELAGGESSLVTRGFESLRWVADQGGFDTARLQGAELDDLYEAGPGLATMRELAEGREPAYVREAHGVELSIGVASGAADLARLHDSPDRDTFRGFAASARFTNFADFDLRANGFRLVEAYYESGGGDRAELYGSANPDRATAEAGFAELRDAADSPSYILRANGFPEVQWQASGAGDTAEIHDSIGNDVLYARPTRTELARPDAALDVLLNFARVTAVAENGGYDVANLYGGSGDDFFLASPDAASLGNQPQAELADYWNEARGFDVVVGHDSPGLNRAEWEDTPGDDVFRAFPAWARLWGDGLDVRANGFDEVVAAAVRGGLDRAELFGSPGSDQLLGGPGYATLADAAPSPSYRIQALGFEANDVQANGVGDIASLAGSPLDDRLVASPSQAVLSNNLDLNLTVRGFTEVTVRGDQGGVDTAELRGSAGNDLYSAGPAYAYLRDRDATAPDYYLLARFFEVVEAVGRGGDDLAYLYDSAGDDLFFGRGPSGTLSGVGFSNTATDFGEVRAYGVNGGVNLRDISGLDYLFQQIGSWRGRY